MFPLNPTGCLVITRWCSRRPTTGALAPTEIGSTSNINSKNALYSRKHLLKGAKAWAQVGPESVQGPNETKTQTDRGPLYQVRSRAQVEACDMMAGMTVSFHPVGQDDELFSTDV